MRKNYDNYLTTYKIVESIIEILDTDSTSESKTCYLANYAYLKTLCSYLKDRIFNIMKDHYTVTTAHVEIVGGYIKYTFESSYKTTIIEIFKLADFNETPGAVNCDRNVTNWFRTPNRYYVKEGISRLRIPILPDIFTDEDLMSGNLPSVSKMKYIDIGSGEIGYC